MILRVYGVLTEPEFHAFLNARDVIIKVLNPNSIWAFISDLSRLQRFPSTVCRDRFMASALHIIRKFPNIKFFKFAPSTDPFYEEMLGELFQRHPVFKDHQAGHFRKWERLEKAVQKYLKTTDTIDPNRPVPFQDQR
jgi:hypothetical protein